MLSRPEIVQRLLNLFDKPRYLEIGVNRGVTFHAVEAARKVAVDPKFVFTTPPIIDSNCTYHEITSDAYFGRVAGKDDIFDVIFLDGLHTFEQTLRDLINSISHLSSEGIIIVDDVIPNSYYASLPNALEAKELRQKMKYNDPSWMGDVYKLVFFVQTFFQKFDYATVQENHGQMIMWQAAREAVVKRNIMAFNNLQFSDVILHSDVFHINSWDNIMEILRSLKRDGARG
jgi:hypothetical protein